MALPPFRRTMRHDDGQFAHPAEREFAQLLSFYRVAWSYEPTTFAIEWAPDGRPCAFFTPDFYLPRHGLYVELTTMRQPLVTRKNRKLRRVRELYPELRIKVLYKRDVQRLQASYRHAHPERGGEGLGEILFSEHEIRSRLRVLGEQVADEWLAGAANPAPLLLVGIGRGSQRTLESVADQLRRLGQAAETAHLALSRYHGSPATTRIRFGGRSVRELTGRRVLLVEDVVSSGLSLAAITGCLERCGVAEWRVCALLDRQAARLIDVPVAWSAFAAPDEVVVGFGLALRREFSRLPSIARLAPRPT